MVADGSAGSLGIIYIYVTGFPFAWLAFLTCVIPHVVFMFGFSFYVWLSCHFKSEKSIKCVLTYDSVCSSWGDCGWQDVTPPPHLSLSLSLSHTHTHALMYISWELCVCHHLCSVTSFLVLNCFCLIIISIYCADSGYPFFVSHFHHWLHNNFIY